MSLGRLQSPIFCISLPYMCANRASPCVILQGTTVVLSLAKLRASVDSALGKSVGQAFMLLTILQFHLPFYASRPLPNTFALALTSLAHADWISSKRPQRAIVLMAATVVGPAIPPRRQCLSALSVHERLITHPKLPLPCVMGGHSIGLRVLNLD